MARYGPLAACAALLFGSALESSQNGADTGLSSALFAAGMIVLGSWLAVETYHLWANHNERNEGDSDEDS